MIASVIFLLSYTILSKMSLYDTFKKTISKDLAKKLGKKNLHQVPTISKIVVSMWIGSLHTRKWVKDFTDLQDNLKSITGQKPYMIRSKQSISNFKLREGMPSMISVTLRGKKAYDFIERLRVLVLPRVRDFNGLNPKSFDKMGNYSIGLKDQSVFPEINYEDLQTLCGLQITIVPTTSVIEESKELLRSLGLVFVNDK